MWSTLKKRLRYMWDVMVGKYDAHLPSDTVVSSDEAAVISEIGLIPVSVYSRQVSADLLVTGTGNDQIRTHTGHVRITRGERIWNVEDDGSINIEDMREYAEYQHKGSSIFYRRPGYVFPVFRLNYPLSWPKPRLKSYSGRIEKTELFDQRVYEMWEKQLKELLRRGHFGK